MKIRVIGRSAFGREITAAVRNEGGGKTVVVTGGIHARENVAARLVAAIALEYRGSVEAWFIPLVNPDGAALAANGAGEFGSAGKRLIEINGGEDFSLWKANARAVDLNVNFPARFGQGRQNVFAPSPANYVGSRPLSEPESAALAAFTLEVKPRFTLSYHAKGRVAYWYFHQRGERLKHDERIATAAAKTLGYELGAAWTDSAGGYKDWCVDALKIPALTLEVAPDSLNHPLPENAVTAGEKRRHEIFINEIERYL